VKRVAPNVLEAQVFVPEDAVWFLGHFPGQPILPGIAVVHAVYEIILTDAQDHGENVRVSSLKRIRFTGPVRPGDTLLISMTGDDAGHETHYVFKATAGDSTVSSGLVAVVKT
jgi:3-hydroxymyristoyl/3-hydroxydecanoyl-(acyl carrier protein) dehydratase